MSDFGKIIGGKLYYAPTILNKDGKQYINPPVDLILEYGYKPLEYTMVPDNINGYHVVSSWEDLGDRLIQRWNYEPNAVLDELVKRVEELEKRLAAK